MEATEDKKKYANFEFGGDSPVLPIEDHSLRKERELGHGAISSVYELSDDKVLKLTRSDINQKTGEVSESDSKPPAVEEYGNDDESRAESRKKAVEELLKYAKERKQRYDLVKKYLGSHLTPIDLFAVVDSPRREIEQLRYSFKDSEELKSIPVSELAVMEVGDKFNPDNDIFKPNFSFLKELYGNAAFQERSADLAKGALELFKNERIMLDFSNFDDIFIVDGEKPRRPKTLRNIDELLSLMGNKGQLPLYRNLVFQDQELQVFDIYPSYEVPEEVSDEDVMKAIEAVGSDDPEQVKSFFDEPIEQFKEMSNGFIEGFIQSIRSRDEAAVLEALKTMLPDEPAEVIEGEVSNAIEEYNEDYTDEDIWIALGKFRSGHKFSLLKYAYQLHFLTQEHDFSEDEKNE